MGDSGTGDPTETVYHKSLSCYIMRIANVLSKSWLLRNRINCCRSAVLIIYLFLPAAHYSQIANYVNNGGFEDHYDCALPAPISMVKYWRSMDSVNYQPLLASSCSGLTTVPLNGFTYQWPRSGESYILTGFLCEPPACSPEFTRAYLRNRLKGNLQQGKTYCVKFYVNISNNSSYGIDGFAAYFGDNSLDTINKACIPLTFLIPQVQNPANNLITDTLKWTLVTGTFVATGNEKNMAIGNFKSDAFTNKVQIDTLNPGIGTDGCVDDVSCIDIDLPPYACATTNTYVIPGDSVFLGRDPDVGIDEDCMWYKLPNTTTPFDTVAGFWAKPVVTTTYVVRQEICGNVKWDTVVVSASALGIEDLGFVTNDLRLYPVPAKEELTLQWTSEEYEKEFTKGEILNSLGQVVGEMELSYTNRSAAISIKDLAEGVYILVLSQSQNAALRQAQGPTTWETQGPGILRKRFIISR